MLKVLLEDIIKINFLYLYNNNFEWDYQVTLYDSYDCYQAVNYTTNTYILYEDDTQKLIEVINFDEPDNSSMYLLMKEFEIKFTNEFYQYLVNKNLLKELIRTFNCLKEYHHKTLEAKLLKEFEEYIFSYEDLKLLYLQESL